MANVLTKTLGALTSTATGSLNLTGSSSVTLGSMSFVSTANMGNIVWPPTLPQTVEPSGYDEAPPTLVIESTMDSGLKKRRKRFTHAPRPLMVTMILTLEQVEIFDQWFTGSCGSGVNYFDWVHPRTRQAATFAFSGANPVKITGRSGVSFLLSMSLEIQ